jgi:hypothetical protein
MAAKGAPGVPGGRQMVEGVTQRWKLCEIWMSCFRAPVVGKLAQVGGCDLKWDVSERSSRHHILFMAAKGAPGVPGGRQMAVGVHNPFIIHS